MRNAASRTKASAMERGPPRMSSGESRASRKSATGRSMRSPTGARPWRMRATRWISSASAETPGILAIMPRRLSWRMALRGKASGAFAGLEDKRVGRPAGRGNVQGGRRLGPGCPHDHPGAHQRGPGAHPPRHADGRGRHPPRGVARGGGARARGPLGRVPRLPHEHDDHDAGRRAHAEVARPRSADGRSDLKGPMRASLWLAAGAAQVAVGLLLAMFVSSGSAIAPPSAHVVLLAVGLLLAAGGLALGLSPPFLRRAADVPLLGAATVAASFAGDLALPVSVRAFGALQGLALLLLVAHLPAALLRGARYDGDDLFAPEQPFRVGDRVAAAALATG